MKRTAFVALMAFAPALLLAQSLLKTTIKTKSPGAIAYTPDNKYLAVATGNEVQLYNSGSDTKAQAFTGEVNKIHQGHTGTINCIAPGPDNTSIATASADGSVKIWAVPSGELTMTLAGNGGGILACRYVENSTYLVTIDEAMQVNLWDLSTQKTIYSKKVGTKPLRALDVSHDGAWIAVGGGDKEILILQTATGEVNKRLSGHDGWVRTLAFSPDGKLLASGADDKRALLWDLESGKPVKELDERGWIYDVKFSNDGKYFAAALEKNAVEFYDITSGLKALKIADFQSAVHAIAISPAGKEMATIEEFSSTVKYWNIESLNISPTFRFKDTRDVTAPQLLVSNPPNLQNNQVTIYKDIIDLRGIAVDESGVRQLKVNGIVTPMKESGNFVINIPLSVGDNPITIEATDINDNITVKRFVITRKDMKGSEYNPAAARNYLVVIGINNYEHWPHLNNAVKDVNDVASVLMSKYTFDFENVTILKDEQATRANIFNSLRSLIEKVTPQDNLMIYYSGHGYFDPLLNEGYWVPVDAETGQSGEYISNSEILKIINNINSQHTFLVADACFSGSLFAETSRGYAENVEQFRSRWGLVSGRLEVVSDGPLGQNSPFARNFVDFLRNNQKQRFAVSELVQYVKLKVAEVSQQTPLGNPLRNAGDEGGEFVFYER